MNDVHRIGLLGFGEVGGMLGADLARSDLGLKAYDLRFDDPDSEPSRAVAEQLHVTAAATAAELARDCDLVISAVTAAQGLPAAQSVARDLAPGALFLDLNSVSPASKRQVAEVVESAGGRYVEAAVLAPFAPGRLASPILLGGPHAESFLPVAERLGFTGMRVCAVEIGRAAAVKMCRSVIVKGVEALVSESLLAARRYGVHEEVLATLGNLFPRPDWPAHARYLVSRTLQHGLRRAEEMQEAAATVSQAGIEPWMSEACVQRQAWAAEYAAALEHEALEAMLDAILAAAPVVTPAGEADAPQRSHG